MKAFRVRWIRAILCLLAGGMIPACGPTNSTNPPAFNGVTSATPLAGSPGEVVLAWSPAVDFTGGGIVYNVSYCIGVLPTNSGQETFQLSTANATGVTVTGLTSSDPYIFTVQAQDSTGATDANTVEVAATAP